MLAFLLGYINTIMSSVSNFDPFELPLFRNGAKRKKSALARRLWEGWKRFGMAVAKVNLLCACFYYLLLDVCRHRHYSKGIAT
jgi:hypothetical protein